MTAIVTITDDGGSSGQLRKSLGIVPPGDIRNCQPIDRLEIVPQAQPIPDAIRALVNADVIVLGPGSLYTSVISNLLVTGIGATLSGVTATRIYVSNLMTQPGETEGYTVEDHLDAILRHVPGRPIDYALVNTTPLAVDVLEHYRREGAERVQRRSLQRRYRGINIVERDLGCVAEDGKVRHCREALAAAILELANASARVR